MDGPGHEWIPCYSHSGKGGRRGSDHFSLSVNVCRALFRIAIIPLWVLSV